MEGMVTAGDSNLRCCAEVYKAYAAFRIFFEEWRLSFKLAFLKAVDCIRWSAIGCTKDAVAHHSGHDTVEAHCVYKNEHGDPKPPKNVPDEGSEEVGRRLITGFGGKEPRESHSEPGKVKENEGDEEDFEREM